MKCKECIYFEEPTIHGHGEYFGYCKIIEKLLKNYDKEINNYNNELEKRLKGFFDDKEILNIKISNYSGIKGFESDCTINKFTQIINKVLKSNNINYELRNNLISRNTFNNSIKVKYPGYTEDWETTRKRIVKKIKIIKRIFTILHEISNTMQEWEGYQEDNQYKIYKYKDKEYYLHKTYYEIANFLIENDFRLR